MSSQQSRSRITRSFILPLAVALLAIAAGDLQAWQQRVHYAIRADLNTADHSYIGYQHLIYVNNSPDTIREVYYHLFYEAFTPGSMMDARNRNTPGPRYRIDQLSENERGSVEIGRLDQNGTALEWSVDQTILRAELAKPLLPGDSVTLEMEWKTVIPRQRRRGGWMTVEGVEYSMAQWYPKLAAYDEHGWHPDEYVEREFYGTFGTYDVEIALPASYVVGATGTLLNPHEVGCGYELGAVDTIIESPTTGPNDRRKTWRFHAENVHDFAWVADREYAHIITSWEGIAIHTLVKQSVLPNWEEVGEWSAEIVEYFSGRFGRYAWPQLTITQAGDGGMEYPMLVMITGYRSRQSLFGVLAHEIGHQWYYGMIANNETQQAWLDEGLTQYLTDEAERDLFLVPENPYTGLDRLVYPWDDSYWHDVAIYYSLAIEGYDEPLVIHHDHFRESLTSSLVYYKGDAIVRMLEYTFGDTHFDRAMRHYYDEWKFRQPDQRDFERALEEATGMRLDWFFNQWIGSTRRIDYAIRNLESEQNADRTWTTRFELENEEEGVMPIDVTLTFDDGSTALANVPVDSWSKPGVDYVLPRWLWVHPTYSASLTTSKRVVRAEIDTSMMLADIDRTDNVASTGFFSNLLPPSRVAFWKRWDLRRPVDRYSIRLRPTLWYSEADGAQIGILADGGYTHDRYEAAAGLYYNIRSRRVDYRLEYRTRFPVLSRNAFVDLYGTNADGVRRWGIGIENEFRPFFYQTNTSHTARLSAEHTRLVGPNYPNAIAPWDSGDVNAIGLGYIFEAWGGPNRWRAAFDFTGSFASDHEFAQWSAEGSWRTRFLGIQLMTEIFAGTSAGDVPAERFFNAAGATSRAMHLNPVHRLAMNSEPEFLARNHLVLPIQGYLLSLADDGAAGRFGRHLLNARLRIEGLGFDPFNLLDFWPLRGIRTSPYAAFGWLFPEHVTFDAFSDYSAEAGVVVATDLLHLLPQVFQDAIDSPAPVRLSLWLPLWAESPLLDDPGFGYRWAIGVSM